MNKIAEDVIDFRGLTDEPIWVCFAEEENSSGQASKPPYQPINPRYMADCNNPGYWGTYHEALKGADRLIRSSIGKSGVGVVLGVRVGDSNLALGVLDLDTAFAATKGSKLRDWADVIITNFDHTRIEVSLNQEGLHVLFTYDVNELGRDTPGTGLAG